MEATKPRNTRYVAALALTASLILVVGWLARPRELPETPAPIPSASELEQLARRAERRAIESRADYFAATARDLALSLMHISTVDATGVVWDHRRIVTAPLPRERGWAGVAASVASQIVTLQPTVRGPHLALTVLEIPPDSPSITPASRASSMPQPGEPVVAIWRTADAHAFVTGSYGQVTSAVCGTTRVDEIVSSIFHGAPMTGGALFNLDGGLLAVILPCNERFAAIGTTSVDAILRHEDTLPQRLLGRYGFSLLVDAVSAQAFSEGVLVSEVWTGSAADIAGLHAGDVITAVDGAAVDDVEDLRLLATPSKTQFALTVRRGSRRVEVVFGPDGGRHFDNADALGIVWRSSQGSYHVASLLPGSRAARAGLQAGDRLITIDHVQPRSFNHLKRILSSRTGSSTLIEIERGERRLAVVLR